MTRIPGVAGTGVSAYIDRVLEIQRARWGAPLANHLLYARRPTIFRGVRGMWAGLEQSGLVPPALVALVNRRVAALNGCEF